MQTTRFRVWLQDPNIPPVWTGVKIVGRPQYVKANCLEVTVQGNGSDLRRLIAQSQDIFAAYLQMKPGKRQDHQRPLNHRQNLTVIRIKPNSIRNGMRSWIVRCIRTPCLLASMAHCDRGEERPNVLAVSRPLPPHPRHQDDDIQSHEEPI